MSETDIQHVQIVAQSTARFGEAPVVLDALRERGHVAAPKRAPGRLVEFLHDVRAEMKRVSWPSLTHVQNTTIITVIAVIFFAVYLFLVDQALSRLITGLDWVLEKLARLLGLA
jgi:preprotein translocase subunit SecE